MAACEPPHSSDTDPTADDSDDVRPPDDPLLGPARSCEVVVEREAGPGTDLSVAGAFNGWVPAPMQDSDGDGVYTVNLGELSPGTWPYKFVFDASGGAPRWEDPPPDVYTAFDGGIENRALQVGDCRLPSLRGESGTASPSGELRALFKFLRAERGAPIDPASVVATVGGVVVEPVVDVIGGYILVEVEGLAPGKHSVRLSVRDTDGLEPEEGGAYLPLWVEPEPFDWASGVLYFAFTDRFRDGGPDGKARPTPGTVTGTDWMGGDLVGVKQALDEGWFDDLGVRSIWISPAYDNPDGAFPGSGGHMYTGYHGYWPIRGRAVEERFGTTEISGEQALHDLVEAAHARGVRVILDSVLNHVHDEHEYLSQFPGWFGADACPCTTDSGPCNWDTNPIYCWFTTYMPDLDYKRAEVTERMLEDARWWVETFDLDGLRVDAAKHMDHVIMRSLSLKMNELYEAPTGTEIYTVGETFTFLGGQGLIMAYVAPWELDGQFDFPLYYALRDAVTNTRWREVSNQAWAGKAAYGDAWHRMSPFMGNHDISRIATDIQGCPTWSLFGGCPDVMKAAGPISEGQWDVIRKTSLAYAVVATMPGVPLLYYGDEIGLAGAGDPDNRRMMQWTDHTAAQQELMARIRALGRMRNDVTALHTGEWRELWVSDSDDLFMYARDAGEEVALFAGRWGWSGSRSWTVPIPDDLGLEGARLVDALGSSRSATVSGGAVTLTLDPWEYVVLVPE
jgi:glycosidase